MTETRTNQDSVRLVMPHPGCLVVMAALAAVAALPVVARKHR